MSEDNGRIVDAPLLAPELAEMDVREALRMQGNFKWAVRYFVEQDPDAPWPVVFAIVGKTEQLGIMTTAVQFFMLAEATRFASSVAVNSNFGRPPILYPKLTLIPASDTMPISRILYGAAEHEAVKRDRPQGSLLFQDFTPENLYAVGGGKPKKDARHVLLKHCEKVAREREAEGMFPKTFTVAAYLENLRKLFTAIDQEAGLTEFPQAAE